MAELLANRVLVVPLAAWLVSQCLKVVLGWLIDRRVTWSYFTTSGGMPSSHSALVAAVATAIGRQSGVGSPLFGAAVIFSVIVMYDAAGVRRTVGTHAKVLNMLLDEFFVRHQIDEARLRELVGHTPTQVAAGALLGMTLALLLA
ncbi:MAG: divergent PAP2 family protein [Chloroflexi bacterium]|nr:divergent PAP2 family protein [Chloroflexota bacterium]MCL5110652.1 divergent PAP2 family protein [Chloroflexota bacterium]